MKKTDEGNPEASTTAPTALSRRSFLGGGAALAGTAALFDPRSARGEQEQAPWRAQRAEGERSQALVPPDLGDDPRLSNDRVAGASIRELQDMMGAGQLTSVQLVQLYQERIRLIDRGLQLNSVLEGNPEALQIAADLDAERAASGPRGPLHGIPILIKDNIDTGDRMQTTAGSLALFGAPALQDATVVAQLRAAGAVILGKSNLSEFANFRGYGSSSGWSCAGGQTRNPHILDRNPGGSSSGSAAAVAASLCSAALGTETDGSIVYPSGACGVVGIKPTVGLTSRGGVVPISWSQDTVGTHGRTVADAAALLGAMVGVDPRDPATQQSEGRSFTDYTQFLDPNGLVGARIGVPREIIGTTVTPDVDVFFEEAVASLRFYGAEVIDDVKLPSFAEFNREQLEMKVLLYEFRRGIEDYLRTRQGIYATNLEAITLFNILFNAELRYFKQEFLELALKNFYSDEVYQTTLERARRLAREEGIDAALSANRLDALVAPTNSPAWPTDLLTGDAFLYSSSRYAAVAGYPLISLPMDMTFNLPLGITFMGTAWSEPTLIRLASGFEARQPAFRRAKPRFLRTFVDETRTEAEVFKGNPRIRCCAQGPQPPVEPVRIFWSGTASRQPRDFGPFVREPEPQ